MLVSIGWAAALLLVALVMSLDRLVGLDDRVWRAVLLARGCGTDHVVEHALEHATNAMIALVLVAIVLHVRRHGLASAWPWIMACLLGLLASRTLKHLFTRERPSSLPDVALGYSFPSAHVMNSLVALIAVIALTQAFRHHRFWLVAAASLFVTVTTARLLLGRHWALDVAGGFLAGLAFVGLVVPLVERRRVLAPVGLALMFVGLFALDNWIGQAGLRLPAPLVGERLALDEVDLGPELRTPLAGSWGEAAVERPGGSLVWLEGSGTIRIDVPDGSPLPALRIALAGRPAKPRAACTTMSVTWNGRTLGRFIPFEGWREYRLPIPPDVVRPGANELALASETDVGPSRFAVARVRLARALPVD
jgi:membrane-associated phospholipid phosphatase